MEAKQLKDAIKDALVPHLIGIRSEIVAGQDAGEARAEKMAEAVMLAMAQLSDPIGQLADSIKALAEKPPAPVEVTNLVEIRIEGASSAKIEANEGGSA